MFFANLANNQQLQTWNSNHSAMETHSSNNSNIPSNRLKQQHPPILHLLAALRNQSLGHP
jgi:hypothetical protein